MANLNELERELSQMPSQQYSNLIRKVEAKRRSDVQQRKQERPPQRGMSKEDFARWIAQQHFDIDKGISRILYLPMAAPDKEVRLVEVNELASIPESAPLEAVDFRPDIDGIDYSLFVVDVTPQQFERLKNGDIPPPTGWRLEKSVDLPRE
jgi:hypothetical protein